MSGIDPLPHSMATVQPLAAREAMTAWRIECAFDLDALAAERRRGTILNERIVIHTTHPEMREIIVPVVGFVPR